MRVVDFSGRIVHEQNAANASSLVLPSGAWPTGKYVVVWKQRQDPVRFRSSKAVITAPRSGGTLLCRESG